MISYWGYHYVVTWPLKWLFYQAAILKSSFFDKLILKSWSQPNRLLSQRLWTLINKDKSQSQSTGTSSHKLEVVSPHSQIHKYSKAPQRCQPDKKSQGPSNNTSIKCTNVIQINALRCILLADRYKSLLYWKRIKRDLCCKPVPSRGIFWRGGAGHHTQYTLPRQVQSNGDRQKLECN